MEASIIRRRPFSLTAAAAAAVLSLPLMAGPAAASHDVDPARVPGETRFDTAADLAELQYDTGTETALIAQADEFPDAMAAAPMAGQFAAPILLTSTDEVPQRTLDALDTLGVTEIYLLGGESAISQDVETTLEEREDTTVDRVSGETRFHTAAAIARLVQEQSGNAANFPGDQRAVFIASGERFPDALATGPLAATSPSPIPILLSTRDTATAPTMAAVRDLNIELAIIAGGTGVISEDVRNELEAEGVNVVREAGANRFGTAVELAEFGIEFLDLSPSTIEVARGDDFPDALAAGPFAGQLQDPILLSAGDQAPAAANEDFLDRHCSEVEVIRAIGGEAAISTAALEALETAAEDCHGAEQGTAQTYVVAPQEPIEVDAGDSGQFEVFARYDDQEFTGDEELDIVLFPSDAVQEVDGQRVFTDANDDDRADGIESTDTGAAYITATNGNDTGAEVKGIRDVGTAGGDPDSIEATIASDAQDDVAVVFFHDANNNSALDLGADDQPTEEWGFGRISFN